MKTWTNHEATVSILKYCSRGLEMTGNLTLETLRWSRVGIYSWRHLMGAAQEQPARSWPKREQIVSWSSTIHAALRRSLLEWGLASAPCSQPKQGSDGGHGNSCHPFDPVQEQ